MGYYHGPAAPVGYHGDPWVASEFKERDPGLRMMVNRITRHLQLNVSTENRSQRAQTRYNRVVEKGSGT
jgi:hypothetical protein